MSRQVVVYAIDSLDRLILREHLDKLPNLRALVEANGEFEVEVVYPPDSPTCWATIFTGENPGRHGIFHFVDPLSRVNRLVAQEIPNEAIVGRTLFDIASRAGKRVCVLNPLLAYPPWDVNGVMVGRATTSDTVMTTPAGIYAPGEEPPICSVRGVPGRRSEFPTWLAKQERLMRSEMDLALDMLQRERWDLVWTYSSVIDSVQHYFWNYFDPEDPSWPGPTEHQDVLVRYLKLHDEMLGRLRAATPEAVHVVVSDHGHMRRPLRTVNLNEALRRAGLLTMKESGAGGRATVAAQKRLKRLILTTINRYGLGNVALKAMKVFPWGKKAFTRPLNIDWTRTLAHISDLSGVKAYVYGGIVVRRENLGERDYESVRSAVIEVLEGLRHPETGEPMVTRLQRREDLYEGPFLAEYPDLVFELHHDFGAGWEVGGDMFGQAPASSIVPGSHRPGASSVFALEGKLPRQPARAGMALADVCPTILDLMGVEPPAGIDGRSIFRDAPAGERGPG